MLNSCDQPKGTIDFFSSAPRSKPTPHSEQKHTTVKNSKENSAKPIELNEQLHSIHSNVFQLLIGNIRGVNLELLPEDPSFWPMDSLLPDTARLLYHLYDAGVKITVPSLPYGQLAVRKTPYTRLGPGRAHISADEWLKSLRTLRWERIRRDSNGPTFSFLKKEMEAGSVFQPIKGGGHYETGTLEFKQPTDKPTWKLSQIFKEFVSAYLQDDLLNTGRKIDFCVGVPDSWKLCIGVDLDEDIESFDEEDIRKMMESKLAVLFPPFKSDISIEAIELQGTIPSDWEHGAMISERSCDWQDVYDAQIIFRGRTFAFQTEKKDWALLVSKRELEKPDDHLSLYLRSTEVREKFQWREFNSVTDQLPESPRRRWLIRAIVNHQDNQIFFNTVKSAGKKTHPIPVPIYVQNRPNPVCMSSHSIWLRCQQASFSSLLQTAFFSGAFLRILLQPGPFTQKKVAAIPVAVSFDIIDSTGDSSQLTKDTLLYRRSSPRLMVIPLDFIEQARNFIARDYSNAPYYLLLLVNPAQLATDISSSLEQAVLTFKKLPYVSIEDVRVDDIPYLPSAASSKLYDSSVVSATSFELIATSSVLKTEEIRSLGKEWITRSTVGPPAWELVRDRWVVRTRSIEHLTSTIRESLRKTAVNGTLTQVGLCKPYSGAGATAMIRAAAFDVNESDAMVVWLKSEGNLASELNLLSTQRPILFVADDTVYSEAISSLLSQYVSASNTIACLLYVRATPPSESWQGFKELPILPLLEDEEINYLVENLKSVVKSDAAIEALDKAQTEAKKSTVDSFQRHLFIFGLAAGLGHFTPAMEMVQNLVMEIKQDKKVENVALAVAFVSAFCPSDSASLPWKSLSGTFDSDRFPPAFWKLFRVQCDSETQTISCVHSFLAKLILFKTLELDFTQAWLSPDKLCTAWKRVSQIFITCLHDQPLRMTIRKVLASRPNNEQFSRFVRQLIEQPLNGQSVELDTMTQLQNRIQLVETTLQPVKSYLEGHDLVITARVYRHAAHILRSARGSKTDVERLLIQSIRDGEAAAVAFKDTPHDLMATQLHAVLLGNAAMNGLPERRKEREKKAHELFSSLYDRDQRPVARRQDIVMKAIKYCPNYAASWRTKLDARSGSTKTMDIKLEPYKTPSWWVTTPPTALSLFV